MIYDYYYGYGYDYGDDYDYDCDYDNEKMGVGRIRTFSFSSDSAYDSDVYDQVQIVGVGSRSGKYTITMLIPTLCDWFSSSTPICDFEYLVFT